MVKKQKEKIEKPATPPKEAGKLVHLDSLQRYFSEIGRFALLTPEEEHRLAVEFQKSGDPEIAYKLVTANLRLVVKIALEHRNYYQNLLDLIQEGNIGLMQAVKRFDPYREVRLPTYAQWWIRAYILKFILENFSLVKIGTTQAQRKLFFRLKREQENLLKEGFMPDSKMLAERIHVTEKEVVEMEKRMSGPEASLETENPVSGRSLMDTLAFHGQSPEDQVANEELRSRMRAAMEGFRETLTPRERVIWDERISNDQPKTFQDLGDDQGITRQRVQQLEQGLKERFKTFLLTKIPEAGSRLN